MTTGCKGRKGFDGGMGRPGWLAGRSMLAVGLLALVAAGLVLLPPVLRPVRAAEKPEAPQAATYTVLYDFTGQPDGSMPYGNLVADSAGNFYGTTTLGGAYGLGAVFELPAKGAETVLYSFTGGSDGAEPRSGLVRDGSGNLYGTAAFGGTYNDACPSGCGVVFKLSPKGKEQVLYAFSGGADGSAPLSGLVRDAAGSLYGTAASGGITSSCIGYGGLNGCGVVYKITKLGSQTVLYSFTGGTDGAVPDFGVARDLQGNIYGTTVAGGDTALCNGTGCGVVFKLDVAGNQTVLYTFTGGSDGWFPSATPTLDASGNLYDETVFGGEAGCGANAEGCGVVFKVDSAGNESTLHTFTETDGSCPTGGLVRDRLGNLYGVTATGGANNGGAIFKLSPSGQETLLYSFTGVDGGLPISGLTPFKGVFYGTTAEGGSGNEQNGVVFKVVP